MSSGSVTENSGYKKSEQPKVGTRQRSSTTPSSTNTGDGMYLDDVKNVILSIIKMTDKVS